MMMLMGWDYVSELQPPMGLLFILKVIHENGEPWWNDDNNKGKLIHPPEIYGNPISSHQVESRRYEKLASQSIFIHTCKWPFTCCKILWHGASGLQRKMCCKSTIALKNPLHWQDFNPRTLGSNGKHANHYTTEARVSLYIGFIPSRLLELKFKGNMFVGRPRRRWFCHLLEDKEG
jgi:hypothetical protein